MDEHICIVDVEFDSDAVFDLEFGTRIEVITDTSGIPNYLGEYTVTPKTYDDQTLQTSGKRMIDNVTVKKIPQYEVSNTSGGKTLIIGDEYNG